MSHLLDASFLVACGWASHARHAAARRWLEQQAAVALCPLSELGFLRVSLSPAYRAGFADAQAALANVAARKQARFISADLSAARLPALASHAEVTDAYFVQLARVNGLKLASLDDSLCRKPWAIGIAENPL